MSNLCLQHVGALFIFVTKNVVLNEFTMLSCTIAVTMKGFIPALMLSFSYSKGFNKKNLKKKRTMNLMQWQIYLPEDFL